MDVSTSPLLLKFFFTFLAVQVVAIIGCMAAFRTIGNARAWLAVGCYAAYLNCAYLFMFSPPPADPSSRAIIEYFLLYPFFSYVLVCLALTPLYVFVGLFRLCRWGARVLGPVLSAGTGFCNSPPGAEIDEGRRALVVQMCSAGIMLPVAGLSLYGSYVGNGRLQVEEHELWFRQLPAGMDGWRLVQISDIHAGPFMDQYELRHFVEIIRGLEPDLVVITGDIINWGDQYVSEAAAVLADIRASAGVFAILGNHDFYCNVDGLCRHLAQAGVQVLRNRWQEIYRDGDTAAFLVGVDDPRSNRQLPFLNQALEGIPEEGFKILLAHRPTVFGQAVAAGMHLTLAGHTHGGQIIIPLPGSSGLSLARIAYERDRGLYRSGNAFLYVNRGLGVVGPPVRINCPREITRIVLRTAI